MHEEVVSLLEDKIRCPYCKEEYANQKTLQRHSANPSKKCQAIRDRTDGKMDADVSNHSTRVTNNQLMKQKHIVREPEEEQFHQLWSRYIRESEQDYGQFCDFHNSQSLSDINLHKMFHTSKEYAKKIDDETVAKYQRIQAKIEQFKEQFWDSSRRD